MSPTQYLKSMAPVIHLENVQRGWWKAPRDAATFVCLFHSEASEAVEGVRRALMDDHLPEYTMDAVELADVIIRCCDYLGYHYHDVVWDLPRVCVLDSMLHNVANIHAMLSEAWLERKPAGDGTYTVLNLRSVLRAAAIAYTTATHFGYPIEDIIDKKRAYNGVRPDHSLEVRESGAVGAKQF